jgi:hypothetical protein
LRAHFAETDANHDRRRIYVVEGLATAYIAAIGGHFFMDPSFFQRHERTCVWSNEFTPTSDALPQPSLLDPDKTFNLQYCELRQFSNIVPNQPFFCTTTGRHVGMTPARKDESTTTAILRRKAAFWSRRTDAGGWDAVILCDPQLHKIRSPSKIIPEGLDHLENKGFQDGYMNFLPIPDRERLLSLERPGGGSKPSHQRQSMFEDMCYYLCYHSDLIAEEEWDNPVTSSFFLKKVVAAHYLQLVDYIKAMLPSLELRLTTAWVEEQDQWKSLQTISRRCGNYSDDIEDTLISLGVPLIDPGAPHTYDWTDCTRDFQYIYHRLKILKQRADTLIQAMTGLASIAGNRQNLEEAKRVKRLTLLGLLFIPLAFTASLFSMQDTFAPGGGKFWIYWVCAIGVVAFTFVATWILDSALDDTAQWTLRPLEWFFFWDKSKRMHPTKPKKRGTGFFPENS